MALNRAQLLVHDDEALARFCVNFCIPDNVIIERPVDNCCRTCKVSKLLDYIPTYCFTKPHQADRKGQPRLPPLRICERASRRRRSLSIEVSDLIEGTAAELKQLRGDAEGESTGSSSSSSLDSSSNWDMDLGDDEEEDAKVEDGEEGGCRAFIQSRQQFGFQLRKKEEVMAPKAAASCGYFCPSEEACPRYEVAPALPIELFDLQVAYLPLLLPNFNKEEYATLLAKREVAMLPWLKEMSSLESKVLWPRELTALKMRGRIFSRSSLFKDFSRFLFELQAILLLILIIFWASAAKVRPRQQNEPVVVSWKIAGSINRDELGTAAGSPLSVLKTRFPKGDGPSIIVYSPLRVAAVEHYGSFSSRGYHLGDDIYNNHCADIQKN
ncbi:hypothetical protein Acr_00g0025460 [Actinidia rufa]|uniref:Uncharacterized protein n=1 Tax=Actinidia rufa TaxID=165716 RepID=A0A7J0DDD8_9ERIC|nr:hypothetical protein Acr_00g0025460 [Actinidia rufa]